MKKFISISLLLTTAAIVFTGCTKSQTREDHDKKIADIIRQSQEDMDKILRDSTTKLEFLTDGGQPGRIALNGVAVLDSEKIDSRITISQSAGLNKSGSSTVTAKNLIDLSTMTAENFVSTTTTVKQTESEKSYINLGCELAESEIAGLTDISDKVDLTAVSISLSASRVFICGEHKISNLSYGFSVTASDIMLKNASLIMQKFTGSIRLESNTLVLAEKNTITTLGENASGMVISAPQINLFVATEIYGDGELTLKSIGGNNVESVESKK